MLFARANLPKQTVKQPVCIYTASQKTGSLYEYDITPPIYNIYWQDRAHRAQTSVNAKISTKSDPEFEYWLTD